MTVKSAMKPSDFFLPYPKAVAVECRPDCVLAVEFDNGEHGVLDMKPYLDKGVFKKLLDPAHFNTARISYDTVEWDDEIDLHPAWVYHKTVKSKSADKAARIQQ